MAKKKTKKKIKNIQKSEIVSLQELAEVFEDSEFENSIAYAPGIPMLWEAFTE